MPLSHMLRATLFLVFVPAFGCDPCADGRSPAVVDPDGLLPDGELDLLRDAVVDFAEWAGGDRTCVETVEIADLTEGEVSLRDRRLGIRDLRLDPDGESLHWSLFWGLCLAMDQAEDLSGAEPGLFPTDDSRHQAFADACADGPRPDIWADLAVDACGYSDLKEQQVYAIRVAFPAGPRPRVDGVMGAEFGSDLRLPAVEGDGWTALGAAPAGDSLAMLRISETVPVLELSLVDLDSGQRSPVLELPTEVVGDARLFGGDRPALVVTDRHWLGHRTLYVVDTVVSEVSQYDLDLPFDLGGGVVSGPWLFVVESTTSQPRVFAIALSTGEVRTIDLPTPPPPLQAVPSGWPVVAPDGFVLSVLDAWVGVEASEGETVTTASVSRASLQRFHMSTGTWTELLDDTWALPAGTTSDGIVVGALFGSGPYLLAGYDLDDDRLLISTDVCLAEFTYPRMVAADRAWVFYFDNDTDVVGRPLDVWE